jgi:dTDP-4-dehydrorhamnose reductase
MTLPRQFRRLRVALVGFGDVARRLLDQRIAAVPYPGHGPRFIAAGRSPPDDSPLAPLGHTAHSARHTWLRCDLDVHSDVRQLVRISQAAVLLAPPADRAGMHSERDMRMRRWAALSRARNHRFPMVYISTTGVYGNHHGGVVTETTVCRAGQPRSRRRLDAESCLRPLGAHVLRAPGIYAGNRLPVARLKAGQPALRDQDDVWTNHIHAEDLARMAWVALFRGRPSRVTNAVDDSMLRMAEYFDKVADALGLPRPPRVSRQELDDQAARGLISPMAMSFMAESRRVHSTRLRQELRIRLRYPTVDHTLRELITGVTATGARGSPDASRALEFPKDS